MKDPNDTKTLDPYPTPRKRGRPRSGDSRSAGERKAAQIERDSIAFHRGEDVANLTQSGLLALLARSVSSGFQVSARMLADELVRRAELKRQQIKASGG